MRKKSHISLAKYIVKNSQDRDLQKHKLSFYLGSILPDCKPSFIYKKHEITGTFPDVKKSIDKLINGKNNKPVKNKRVYYVNLGQVTHYIADYFTFPHNKIYPGTLKDHCTYEEKLKLGLRQYIKSGEADKRKSLILEFDSQEALYEFIQNKHDEYLKKQLNVDEDVQHIVATNHQLVEGISELFHETQKKYRLQNP